MRHRLIATLAFAALALPVVPALAQDAANPSMTCRLFPLACPGPTPPMPQPLVGTPEEQAETAPPVPVAPVKHKRRTHKKHAAAAKAD